MLRSEATPSATAISGWRSWTHHTEGIRRHRATSVAPAPRRRGGVEDSRTVQSADERAATKELRLENHASEKNRVTRERRSRHDGGGH